MCGIAGYINFDRRPAQPDVLERMVRTIDHRGPDGTGAYVGGPVALGHNRLSIIDLAGGHQPMSVDQETLWITFNGEIFNYVELRADLEKKGHQFRTHSDTEVILRLYRQYGADCVQYLNGQWAFAIWDTREQVLFLSRDRLGVRPLFFTEANRSFVFGSEVKALLAHPGVNAELDLEALGETFRFWFPLAPRTIFKDVQELAPGHSLIIRDGRVRTLRYWEIDYSHAAGGDSSASAEEQAVEEFRHLLEDATRIRLRADVPVGAYLSGGLDSSVTTALAQRFVGQGLCTFSLSFEDPSLDESPYQAEVVRRLGTRHHEVRCASQEIGRVFPDVIRHTERPILRTAPAPMYLLAKLVRESGYKVVLTGEGSDEFLGGYDIYKEAKVRAFWAAQLDSRLRPLLLKRLYPYMEGMQKQSPAYLRAFFHVNKDSVGNPFFSHVPRWELTGKAQLFFSEDVKEQLNGRDPYDAVAQQLPKGFTGWDVFSRAQYLEAAFLLPDYLLSSQGDRPAMAHAVEGRYPFLDYRVVEFSTRLSPKLKMKVLNEKYLLKRAFGNLVPDVVLRRPKQPYRAPDVASFYDAETGRARHDYVDDLLSAESIRANNIFGVDAVQKLVEKAKAGRATSFFDNAALVGVLSTQILIDQFMSVAKEKRVHVRSHTGPAPVCH